MALRPPPGFVTVDEAQGRRDRQLYSVIGLCADYLPPVKSRGSDFAMKINLWDTSCNTSSELGNDGMLTRHFYGLLCRFPRVEEIGDIVVLKNLKTISNSGIWFGISNAATTWAVIPGTSLLDSEDPTFADVDLRPPYDAQQGAKTGQGPRPTPSEFRYAKALLQTRDPGTLRAPPKSTALDVGQIITASGGRPPPTKSLKYRMLKDLADPAEHGGQQFVDLLGEVRRVYFSGNPAEVKITDYTVHPLLYNYGQGDVYDSHLTDIQRRELLEFPKGRMTIKLTFWDEHSQHIRDLAHSDKLRLGDYMRVKNVNIRMDRNMGQLEGHLRGSSGRFGNAFQIVSPKDSAHDEDLHALLKRKREYELHVKAEMLKIKPEAIVPAKRMAEDATQAPAPQNPVPLSKAAKKKQRKKEKQEAKKKDNSSSTNQHVRCEAISIPLTTIATILDSAQLERRTPAGNPFNLPFQNCKYKSKVRVMDFFPDNLEDFATPYRTSEYEALSDYESENDSAASLASSQNAPDHVRWEWHFCLMVQDADTPQSNTSTMILQVAGQDGDYLLNMEACDLRSKAKEFAKLKEKMFVLWGDLQEKKTEHGKTGQELQAAGIAISSTPFECLIREYGVQGRAADGAIVEGSWERMFGMFKTNIR